MTLTKAPGRPSRSAEKIAAAQPPHAGKLNLDHVAHFVPDIDAASAAFAALGFTLTPFSAQMQRNEAGELVSAGAGNRCIMLERGYLECLTPTGDTIIGRQLSEAIARYTGLHLIAFGSGDAAADYARLNAQQFAPLPTVDLQRSIATVDGEGTARFSVVRVPPGTMAEGRIQFCQQHTPELLWQARWTRHRNQAVGLKAVIVCVENPEEAAQRYARFTGLQVTAAGASDACWRLDTARGFLLWVSPALLQQALGVTAPALPWIAGTVIDSDDLPATQALVNGNAFDKRVLVKLDASLGGLMLFQASGSGPLQLI